MSDIAIIGMAGRFPGATTINQLWENLCAGVESIRDIPEGELQRSHLDDSTWRQENFVRRAAFPDDVELFDAQFFGFTPREAALTDPQHRLLLECAHEALEDSGYDSSRYSGAIAVFAGCALNSYLLTHLMASGQTLTDVDLVQLNLASSPDFLATRISYKLGLRGPSHSVQCACSTSLVAVHLACQNLRSGESDMALAGGVALNFQLRYGYSRKAGGMFSASGRCRPFDIRADGTVFGNGAGIVVLKRLAEALADRDHIYAVIRGSAVNNDGSAKVGYTAPSVDGQALVIAEALANANLPSGGIGYIEAHGTGTELGDPVEVQALIRGYGNALAAGHRCLIGSIKSNIGHLDCAAGVSGLIKAALTVKNGLIPPQANFEAPNALIPFEASPLRVNVQLTQWDRNGETRRAAVSAFGVGGTNAHLILEELPQEGAELHEASANLILFSAATTTALERSIHRIQVHLAQHPEINIEDAAFTLALGRRQMVQRAFQVVGPGESLEKSAVMRFPTATPQIAPSVTFLFPGQGTQSLKMGHELYASQPAFREAMDKCIAILGEAMDCDSDTLTSLATGDGGDDSVLRQTEYTQPLLFSFEYCLLQLFTSWGIQPAAMIGHSLGEYVAACAGGTITLEDALQLMVTRGILMQSTEPGAMLSVALSETEALAFVDQEISLAAINGPSQCVLSGRKEAIHRLRMALERDGFHVRRLAVERSFHSVLMDPILQLFEDALEHIELMPPRTRWISNLTGQPITDQEATDPKYWVKHLRHTVRFYDCLKAAHNAPSTVFLEVGPGRVLQQLASRLPLSQHNQIAVASMANADDESVSLLLALGTLWLRGIAVDWKAFYHSKKVRRVSLPTYPFEKQRCWVEAAQLDLQDSAATKSGNSNTVVAVPPGSITTVNARPSLAQAYIAPANDLQRRLASIFEQAFGIAPIGIRDNFFALGADSLMAVAVIDRLRAEFHVDLTAAHIYEALDVASLAQLIEELRSETSQGSGGKSFPTATA